MKIRMTEEIGACAKLWYTIYVENTYVHACTDKDEADEAFKKVEQLIKQGYRVEPQTIKEEQI